MKIKYPVKDKTISQPFGRDVVGDPVYGSFYKQFNNKHCGVDFPVKVGTPVYASFSGKVVRVEDHKGMGLVVGVQYKNILALYAHLSSIKVKVGQYVSAGDEIALSGQTGAACPTPHLHFELRDISKNSLKDMVFNPPFGQEVKQLQENFNPHSPIYIVRKFLQKILSKII